MRRAVGRRLAPSPASWQPAAQSGSRPDHPFFAPPLPHFIAHRGASGTHPENTLVAFRAAAAAGAEMIELDVHLSVDRVPVVIHDATLERTTDGRGLVAACTAAELAALDAGYRFSPPGTRLFPFRGAGHGVPPLLEVLRALPTLRFTLEIKTRDPGLDDVLPDVLRESGAEDRVLLASQYGRVVRRLRRGFPGYPTNFGSDEVAAFVRSAAVPAGAAALQVPPRYLWRRLVTRRFVEAAHAAGLEVQVWTINTPRSMHELLNIGVDGIMTDFPERLLGVYRERGLR